MSIRDIVEEIGAPYHIELTIFTKERDVTKMMGKSVPQMLTVTQKRT